MKINILVVTYNHEKYIGRFLDSIICQKDYGINKIILSDDKSTDNNTKVINEYIARYPNLIELHENPVNLGVYGNFNHLLEIKGDADLYYIVAGDDAFCDGFFKQVQYFCNKKKLNAKDRFMMFFDWKIVKPNGKEVVVRNSKVNNKKHITSLKLRNYIYIRSTFVSRGTINLCKPVSLDGGVILSEILYDIQPIQKSMSFYYESIVGSIYYSQIGVSQTYRGTEIRKRCLKGWELVPEHLKLSKSDKCYVNMQLAKYKFSLDRKVSYLLKFFKNYILCKNPALGLDIKSEFIMLRSIFKLIVNG
ncbi:MAG: glycosyltransferase [Eubacteriales bacterium]|nr:glycosyltransferase [Eubacteriales bacterium]